MIVATIMSTGATGVSMLVIAAPFLLPRETPSVIMMATATAVVVLIAAYMLDAPLPLISRAGELHSANSSGGSHVLLPAERLATLVLDPSYSLMGDGAGAVMGAGDSLADRQDCERVWTASNDLIRLPFHVGDCRKFQFATS